MNFNKSKRIKRVWIGFGEEKFEYFETLWLCEPDVSHPFVKILSRAEVRKSTFTIEKNVIDDGFFFCHFRDGTHGTLGRVPDLVVKDSDSDPESILITMLMLFMKSVYPECVKWSVHKEGKR